MNPALVLFGISTIYSASAALTCGKSFQAYDKSSGTAIGFNSGPIDTCLVMATASRKYTCSSTQVTMHVYTTTDCTGTPTDTNWPIDQSGSQYATCDTSGWYCYVVGSMYAKYGAATTTASACDPTATSGGLVPTWWVTTLAEAGFTAGQCQSFPFWNLVPSLGKTAWSTIFTSMPNGPYWKISCTSRTAAQIGMYSDSSCTTVLNVGSVSGGPFGITSTCSQMLSMTGLYISAKVSECYDETFILPTSSPTAGPSAGPSARPTGPTASPAAPGSAPVSGVVTNTTVSAAPSAFASAAVGASFAVVISMLL